MEKWLGGGGTGEAVAGSSQFGGNMKGEDHGMQPGNLTFLSGLCFTIIYVTRRAF